MDDTNAAPVPTRIDDPQTALARVISIVLESEAIAQDEHTPNLTLILAMLTNHARMIFPREESFMDAVRCEHRVNTLATRMQISSKINDWAACYNRDGSTRALAKDIRETLKHWSLHQLLLVPCQAHCCDRNCNGLKASSPCLLAGRR
jgi:hypothetical protein